ncbi:MAG: hypothetical protein RL329_292, partial [Bacteroidota bacterium]
MKYIIISLLLVCWVASLQAQQGRKAQPINNAISSSQTQRSDTGAVHPWKLEPTNDFTPIEPFSEGYAVVRKKEKRKKKEKATNHYYYLTKEGQFSTNSTDTACSIFNGLSAVRDSAQKWHYRKTDGTLLSGEYDDAYDFNNGLAVVNNGGKWGVIDHKGSWQLQNYEALRPFADNWAGAQKDGKMMITNLLGNHHEVDYDYIGTFSEGLVQVSNPKGDFGYINTQGEEVIKIVKGRKYVTDFFNGFAAVCDTFPNITYIDRQGKKVFWIKDGAKYQKSMNGFREGQGIFKHQFKDGFAPIYQKDKDKNRYKWGFIDTNFKTVIPCKYDQVTPFSE